MIKLEVIQCVVRHGLSDYGYLKLHILTAYKKFAVAWDIVVYVPITSYPIAASFSFFDFISGKRPYQDFCLI